MKSLRSGLVMALTAGALVVIPAGNTRGTRTLAARGDPDPKVMYTTHEKEHYLSEAQVEYVRPGLKITVNSITINDSLHPVVNVTYTDDLGVPLDRSGRLTPGPISMSFILAWYDAGERQYTSYTTRNKTSAPESQNPGVTVTQASSDSGGTWNDIDIGHSIYTFGTMLPANYDQTITTTLGIYATRNMSGIQDKNYYYDVEQDFVPDGAPVTEAWDEIANSACNTCHNPLSAHGGSRYDVKLCVLCHSPQTVNPDSGNTADFKVMIHKIHMGESLPSVADGIPYYFYGRGNVTDFSEVAFPQDIRNCATCHAPPATQNYTWYTYPSQAACGACHDNINWTTGQGHPAGVQPDSACASCHQPVGSQEWDASVQGAHTVPYKSTQLQGLNAEILSVANAAPGQMPTVNFKLTQNDGTVVPPAQLGSNINVLMGGPTTDYAINPVRQRADGASFNGTIASYTFTTPIPENATGTWAFSIEARQTVTLNPHPNNETTFTEGAMNPVYYASLDGTEPMPRRLVVALSNCNKCHNRLALHGGQRLNTVECVMCHNPNADDSSRRPADQAPPESIDFKRMVHRIHTGEELVTTSDCIGDHVNDAGCFTIYGFGGSVNNFNHVLYPGDRRDCLQCHLTDTQQVEEVPPPGLLETPTLRDYYTPMQHYATACLGCHSSQPAAAHAFTMTAPFGEACAACHGPGAEFSVDQVHAR
jgi:OmcA/MtrC family decaheme c-type cytochrome